MGHDLNRPKIAVSLVLFTTAAGSAAAHRPNTTYQAPVPCALFFLSVDTIDEIPDTTSALPPLNLPSLPWECRLTELMMDIQLNPAPTDYIGPTSFICHIL